MNLLSKNNIRNLLKQYNIKPSKRLGQNFLIDKAIVKKIIKTADIKASDNIIEIGPGIGTITQELAKAIVIEKDREMVKILKQTIKNNIEIVQKDILKYEIKIKDYKVIGNIPFYLTAPLIRKLLESKNPPKEITLIIQKEVAQRICAKPPKMSILAVSVQLYAKPRIISYVSKKSFWPCPKVDSAIIKISDISSDIEVDKSLLFKIVKAGFSQPRKQIINNLSKKLKLNKEEIELWLLKNNIQPKQRAETLSIDDWIKLTNTYKLFTC
jgi:16S rRNA (adenine1518-N6/adenine1519-N6)-dimethyltransferase